MFFTRLSIIIGCFIFDALIIFIVDFIYGLGILFYVLLFILPIFSILYLFISKSFWREPNDR
jgi:hypothetical protein